MSVLSVILILAAVYSIRFVKTLKKMSGHKVTITEKSGDLFSAPKEYSIGHCVSADLRMGKGIAVKFRDTFGQIQTLKNQNAQTGGLAVLKDDNRFIYYMVTKATFYQKPTYQSMYASLTAVKDHMKLNNVTKLAIPKIGCGLDGLNWDKVKDQLHEVFSDEAFDIVVYNFVAKK
ncbi:hypothetical protein HA402_002976 [Bradysia odoriphaga]|nr:hypothetical protein HA402_002976 [Bradysia odoriphaga]